ncbi:hypothetical protein AQS8620_01560 [Aquimixticola soesokkakensis]|uniref:Uncharacterized protein n=1 Tax=Aquimixticola soesokkakensis TaxID=1519096 RepID=A0A1Y5SIG0_9RHOB|nr:hypothetical protein [Aquimixticola soesokkakensis]SLN40874.1 hypothetical protein AQS8620_01560 [Aquimixticola soesokkakensis]
MSDLGASTKLAASLVLAAFVLSSCGVAVKTVGTGVKATTGVANMAAQTVF